MLGQHYVLIKSIQSTITVAGFITENPNEEADYAVTKFCCIISLS
jgi:hypothetical protein